MLCSLPMECRVRVVAMLPPTDALQFTESFPEVGVSITHVESPLFHRDDGDFLDRDQPSFSGYRLPILTDGTVQHLQHPAALRFHCQWQKGLRPGGWGNRKGRVYIVGHNNRSNQRHPPSTDVREDSTTAGSDDRYKGGRLVASTTEIAPRRVLQDCEIEFVPKQGETYTLWYSCGDGGGHKLFLENVSLHMFVTRHNNSDVSSEWAQHYKKLYELGLIGQQGVVQERALESSSLNIDIQGPPRRSSSVFYTNMLFSVCQSLRAQLLSGAAPMDSALVQFMSGYQIPVTETSLQTVKKIIQADLVEQEVVWGVEQRVVFGE